MFAVSIIWLLFIFYRTQIGFGLHVGTQFLFSP